jgi:hypothetical protein
VASDDKARIASLEAALGRAHLELDFMRHYARELEQKRAHRTGKAGNDSPKPCFVRRASRGAHLCTSQP